MYINKLNGKEKIMDFIIKIIQKNKKKNGVEKEELKFVNMTSKEN